MIGKDELLRILRNASELEESHTPVIAGFFLNDFEWGDVDAKKVERVKVILRVIEKQTLEHERMLDEMMGRIGGLAKDGF